MRISDGSSDVCSSDLQVAVHTNGDAAIDVALDAIEAAISSAPERDHRHRLAHVKTVREDQLERIVAAGILPSGFVNHEIGRASGRERVGKGGSNEGGRVSF